MSIIQLEKKYGITVADDSYYNPIRNKFVKAYKIYSADGCRWECGLKTVKAIEKECNEWAETLLSIKRKVAMV